MLFAIPQRSILVPLLFLILVAGLFYLNYDLDIASYADDAAHYIYRQDIYSIIKC